MPLLPFECNSGKVYESAFNKLTFPDSCTQTEKVCISFDADSLMAQVVYSVPSDRQASVELHTRAVRSSIRVEYFKIKQKYSKLSVKIIKLEKHNLTK